jgi:hypothetical protein
LRLRLSNESLLLNLSGGAKPDPRNFAFVMGNLHLMIEFSDALDDELRVIDPESHRTTVWDPNQVRFTPFNCASRISNRKTCS